MIVGKVVHFQVQRGLSQTRLAESVSRTYHMSQPTTSGDFYQHILMLRLLKRLFYFLGGCVKKH